MTGIFYTLGSIAFAVYIWTAFSRWREKRWVKESLKPYAGLDYVDPQRYAASQNRHILYRRMIWCGMALGFFLMIAIPWLMSKS